MLTYEDEATIRNAIWKRLHEPGKTEITEIEVINFPNATPPHLQVSVWFVLKDRIQMEGLVDPLSMFDLPAEFTHRHLLNEIDEISEQLKTVRQNTRVTRLLFTPGARRGRLTVTGTGLRGRWGADAPKDGA